MKYIFAIRMRLFYLSHFLSSVTKTIKIIKFTHLLETDGLSYNFQFALFLSFSTALSVYIEKNGQLLNS